MGVYSDILAAAETIDMAAPREGNDRAVVRALRSLKDRQGDLDYPEGYEAVDEVQQFAAYGGTVSAGTPTITIKLKDQDEFTTEAFAYDADAATIQTAIDDAAALAGISGYTAGDIAVSGGPLTSDALVLTYSGASVAGQNHDQATIQGTLTGGTVGAASTTTEGQTKRTAWAVLRVSGVISGTPPTQGESATVTADTNRHTNPFYPDQDTIRALAHEAAVADGNGDVETAILSAVGL